MNIYLVSRADSIDYDEYDSFVCVATDEETARKILPSSGDSIKFVEPSSTAYDWGTWVPFEKLDTLLVSHIGTANSNVMQIVCSSFNAG